MAERIYSYRAGNSLEPLEESPFNFEHELQSLIAEHPELLDGEQMRPGDPLRWMLITREKGIADKPDAADRWAVDHLILDQDARPTLVEVKRGENTQIRREIVGQMMEYAAHAQQTWTIDELRQALEDSAAERGRSAEEELAQLLGSDTEIDVEAYWEKAATNLAASRLRLLFVSDNIPDELERVTTFLNEQMPDIEVLAVEIKRFKGQSTQTLVPRVLGRILKAPKSPSSAQRRFLTRQEFLEGFNEPHHREAVERLMKSAEACGAYIPIGTTGISIRVECEAWAYKYLTVAWLFLPGRGGWAGLSNANFGEAASLYKPPPAGDLKDVLDAWADSCNNLTFGGPVSKNTARGKTFDYDDLTSNVDQLEEMLGEIIPRLAQLPPI